jgi:rare lipoprotein A
VGTFCVALAFVLDVEGCRAQADDQSSGSFSDRFYFNSPSAGQTHPKRKPPRFLKGLGVSPAEATPAVPPTPANPSATADSSQPQSTASAPAPAAKQAGADSKAGAKSKRGRRVGRGRASYYEHPGQTASGERYNPDQLTAAHKTLPLGTRVRVVNLDNGKTIVVRINDRMPAHLRNVIDLSRGSARAVGISRKTGVANVALYQVD